MKHRRLVAALFVGVLGVSAIGSAKASNPAALNGTAGRIGITVGNTSGAQNTICSEKDWSGLAAKTQPPCLTELVAHG